MRISARAAAKATDAARADARVTNATTTSSFAAPRAASIAATASAYIPAANAVTNAAKAAAKSADAVARTNPSTWISIRDDLYDLKVVGDIVHHRLFDTENLPSVLAIKLSDFNNHAHATNPNWIIISHWYQTLLNSNMSKTPWGELGSKMDMEIAIEDDEFWDRDPDVVIDEIAEIVGWNENQNIPQTETALEQLSQFASPQIGFDEQNRLHPNPNSEYDAPIIDEDLVNLPQVQVAAADMLRKQVPKNAPLIIKDALKAYRDHLEQRGAQPILGILVQFADAVLAEYKGSEGHLWGDGLASLFASFEARVRTR